MLPNLMKMKKILLVTVAVDYDLIAYPGTVMIHLQPAVNAASGMPANYVTPLHVEYKDLQKANDGPCADAPLGVGILTNAIVMDADKLVEMLDKYVGTKLNDAISGKKPDNALPFPGQPEKKA